MKKIIIVLTFALPLQIFSNDDSLEFTFTSEPNVILVNGKPALVEMTKDGKILAQYSLIDTYFESETTHEQVVNTYAKIFEDERAIYKVENLDFAEGRSILRTRAILRLRTLSNAIISEKIDHINVSVGGKNTSIQQDRLNAVLLIVNDFGISKSSINLTYTQTEDITYEIWVSGSKSLNK